MKHTFAAIVQRAGAWDQAKPPQEQSGFANHAAFVATLEAEGFIALAGLMVPSTDVLFIFLADSEEEVRRRMSADPWQKDGHALLTRVEEIHIRIGAPKQPAD
jgi:uncharacterized protein YciI